jgi:anaerobic carbon-monoxide dehydrogenase catalytic subunit
VAASAPEWYSEKAAAIGLYAVASGVYTHLGLPPHILGSSLSVDVPLGGPAAPGHGPDARGFS